MARNEEKQYCRLNRALLQQEKEELEKKNPKRPRLETLITANEVKQWIPSIKKDLEFCLAQSQVPCYPENKIADFQSDIQKLEREFKAFVRKAKQLEPELNAVPWTNRPYKSQNEESCDNSTEVTGCTTEEETFAPIETPVIDGILPTTKNGTAQEVNLIIPEQFDKPLIFCTIKADNDKALEKSEDTNLVISDENMKISRQNSQEFESKQTEKQTNKHLYIGVTVASNGKPISLVGLDYNSSDSDN